MVHQLLVSFQQKNKAFPQRILFYRDGVSEGQYAEVMQKEVAAVMEALEHAKIKASLTFCVVKKRHHARLFPMKAEEADKSGNCIAGTVVDSVITHPTEFDFCMWDRLEEAEVKENVFIRLILSLSPLSDSLVFFC
jgi:eukaryotic translation initiation factor 2C